jgi:hypothetical protein
VDRTRAVPSNSVMASLCVGPKDLTGMLLELLGLEETVR